MRKVDSLASVRLCFSLTNNLPSATKSYRIQTNAAYMTQEAGLSEQGGMGGMDAQVWPCIYYPLLLITLSSSQDLFSQLFGGGGGFFGGPGGGGGRSQGPRKTKDLVHRVHVTLEDLYKGKTTKLALKPGTLFVPNAKGRVEKTELSDHGTTVKVAVSK